MTIQEFFDKYNGKGIDFDNYYGFQCMDLAEQYNQEVTQAPRLTGNAVDVWTTYPKDYYDRIENTPNGIPEMGDVIIWGQGVGQYGHIAVFDHGDQNAFTSFDQNWPLNSLCHYQNHNYNGVLGWLHPKKTDNGIIPPSGESMTDEQKRVLQFIDENKGSETNLESVVRNWFGAFKDVSNYIQGNNVQVNQISQLQKDLNSCLARPTDAPKTASEGFILFLRLLFKT